PSACAYVARGRGYRCRDTPRPLHFVMRGLLGLAWCRRGTRWAMYHRPCQVVQPEGASLFRF
ncbi:MAG: hypothetical protein IKY83_06715, partial [Proteobacteria bacterium]|nr:hypothetical protein [Pseudomonadota bacterium]